MSVWCNGRCDMDCPHMSIQTLRRISYEQIILIAIREGVRPFSDLDSVYSMNH